MDAALSEFLVRITYREPSYELRMGRGPTPYSWACRIAASSPLQAIETATQQFKELERLSMVGWVREVVEVIADAATTGSP